MATTQTYNKLTKPAVRKELKDFFPRAYAHYPGYIRQAVFREKLKTVMLIAVTESHVKEKMNPVELVVNPLGRYSLRECVLIGIQAMDWKPNNVNNDMSKQLRAQAKASLAAATVKPAIQIGAGKLISKGVGMMNKGAQGVMKNDKINSKVGKALNVATKTYEPFNKPGGKGVTWVSINASETGIGMMVGRGMDWVAEKASPDTETVTVSLNNDKTREWLMKTGMSEGWANGTLEVADLVSDWIPVAAITKMVESSLINGYMSWTYWRMAADADKFQKQIDEKWNELIRNLKDDISADIIELSDQELTQLFNLLDMKK